MKRMSNCLTKVFSCILSCQLAVCVTVTALLTASCTYDESFEVLQVTVSLQYPANTLSPYAGAHVELTDTHGYVFTDSTDAHGTAHFLLPPGIYEAASSGTHLTYDYRYIYNGTKGRIVISPDSVNNILLPITVTKKRIVH